MKEKVIIPPSVEAAVERLEGLGLLLTASGWERAAIVWAFAESHEHATKSVRNTSERLGFGRFAELGVHGLTSPESVSYYWGRWQKAIDDGWAEATQPGKPVDLPMQTFSERTAKEAIDEVAEYGTDGEVDAVADAATEAPRVGGAIAQKVKPARARRGTKPKDYDALLRRMSADGLALVLAFEDGEWQPTEVESVLASLTATLLNRITTGGVDQAIFDDVKEYLSKAKKEARK